MAIAMRVAQAEDFRQAVDSMLPEPEPLVGTQDDDYDRSQWWTPSYAAS